jgi:PAS domain S-box-containing protein
MERSPGLKTGRARLGRALVGQKTREPRNVLVVIFLAIALAGFSLTVRLSEAVYRLLVGLIPPRIFNAVLQFLFLYLLGLLLVTYRRWRVANKRERELENIISSISPDALLVANPERRIVMCNPSVKQMFGFEPEELLGRTTDLLYGDRRSSQRFHEIYDELARRGYHIGQARGRKRNGSSMPLEIVSGELSGGGVVLLLRDISDRVQAEEALKVSQEKYTAIVNNALVGIFQTSAEGKFLTVNATLARLFGFNVPAEFLAKVKSLGPDLFVDQGRYKDLERQLAVQGNVSNFEASLQRPGGPANGAFWSSLSVRAVRDPGGALLTYEGIIEDISSRREAEETMRQSLERLRKATGSIIDVMVMAVEARDPYTSGHQRRVANLARAIAADMGMPRDRIDGLRMAGVVHDLGKISIPAEILTTPRKLSEIEFNLVKSHAQLGHDLIKDIDFPWPIAEMILQHHERLDGSGYPRGLKGEAIMVEARILAVADAVEAISSHRPYRPALGLDKALEDITQGRGTLYDPAVVDICLKLFQDKGFKFDRESY